VRFEQTRREKERGEGRSRINLAQEGAKEERLNDLHCAWPHREASAMRNPDARYGLIIEHVTGRDDDRRRDRPRIWNSARYNVMEHAKLRWLDQMTRRRVNVNDPTLNPTRTFARARATKK